AVPAVSPGRAHSRAGGTRVLARSIDRAGAQQLPRHAAPAPQNLGRRTLGDALERPVRGGLTGRGGFRRQSLRARRHRGTRTTPEARRYDAARGGDGATVSETDVSLERTALVGAAVILPILPLSPQ